MDKYKKTETDRIEKWLGLGLITSAQAEVLFYQLHLVLENWF